MPHIIIYGHEAGDVNNNRLMFGGLQNFLDEQYLSDHPVIMFMENDSLYEFEIFSARMTDIYDPAYQLDFSAPDSLKIFLERNNAPTDAKQIITLSTCVGAGNNRRMIVQGVLKRIVPVKVEYRKDGWRIVRPD